MSSKRATVTTEEIASLDKALLYGLVAVRDQNAILELGHFGSATYAEAQTRMQEARHLLKNLLEGAVAS